MAEVFPRGTSKLMSSRTTWLPNRLETPWIEMTGSDSGTCSSAGGDSPLRITFPFLPNVSSSSWSGYGNIGVGGLRN